MCAPPSCPPRRSADALDAAYDELAAAYAEIGANWTVWVWPDDDAPGRFLEGRGHVLDAQPAAMIHDLEGLERPAPDALADWTASGDFAVVGPLNDRAYGFDTDSFTRAMTRNRRKPLTSTSLTTTARRSGASS